MVVSQLPDVERSLSGCEQSMVGKERYDRLSASQREGEVVAQLGRAWFV